MAQGRRQQTRHWHTQDIHNNKAPGPGRSFLSRFRDDGGEENTDFPKAPGSCPGRTPRLRCRIAGPFPCSGTPFSLAAVGSRWATPEPDALSLGPPGPRHAHQAPRSPQARLQVFATPQGARSPARPAAGVRRSRPAAAAPTAARTRVPFRPAREGRDRRRRPHLSGAVRLYSGSSAAARAPPHPPSRK